MTRGSKMLWPQLRGYCFDKLHPRSCVQSCSERINQAIFLNLMNPINKIFQIYLVEAANETQNNVIYCRIDFLYT